MQKGILRRIGVGALGALTLGSVGLIPLASSAGAIEGFAFERLAGDDRYETAAEIAADTFPTGSDTVVIARDALNAPDADALAGNYVAGLEDAPILVTTTNELHPTTAAAVEDLGATRAIIMGGTAAVGTEVEDELEDMGLEVERVAGATRYGTAAATLDRANATVGEIDGMPTAFLARSEAEVGQRTSPDALSVGPESFAANIPVLLTRQATTPTETLDALDDAGIEHIYILGGPDAISVAQEDALEAAGYATTRVGGDTRADTAIEIATVIAEQDLGWDFDHVDLARGDESADALAGGPHGGVNEAPLLINPGACSVDSDTIEFLEEIANELAEGHIFGGPAAVCEDVEEQAEEAAQGTGQAFGVSPSGPQQAEADSEGVSSVDYTVTGVENPVNIATVPCESIEDGVFNDDDGVDGEGDNLADDLGDTSYGNAFISEVNGAPQSDTYFTDINPVNGVVTFTIESSDFDCAFVVIWEDTDNDGELDLGDNNRASEPVSIAGPITFFPEEAESGFCFNHAQVVYEDEDSNTLVLDYLGDTFIVHYGTGDTYSYEPQSGSEFNILESEFEEYVTVHPDHGLDRISSETGDDEEQCYSRTAGNVFQIEEEITNPVPNVNASAGDFNDPDTDADDTDTDADDVRVTWNEATGGRVESYTVFAVLLDAENEAADDDSCEDFSPGDIFGAVINDEEDEDAREAVLEGLDDGTYCIFVATQSETGDYSDPSEPVTVTVDADENDTTNPTIEDLRVNETGGTDSGVLDAGDVVTFEFSEDMDPDTALNTIFRFTDQDDELFQVECSTANEGDQLGEATCAMADGPDADTDADDALVVTLVDDPNKVGGPAGDGAAQLAGQLTVLVGATDLSGNTVDLAASEDTELDNEL